MNKSELIKALAEENALSAEESTLVVETFFDSMKKALADGSRVELRGLGSFKLKEYEGYSGRNPKTGIPRAKADKACHKRLCAKSQGMFEEQKTRSKPKGGKQSLANAGYNLCGTKA